MNDTCKHCGAWYGLHQAETMRCPAGGVEAPVGRTQYWLESTFEAEQSDELAALRAENAKLREALRDLVNALPDTEIEIARHEWGNTNTSIIKGKFAIARALLGSDS